MKTIQMIEYGVGNKRNLMNAFKSIGWETRLCSKPEEINPSAPIVLPGVGSFAFCKKRLLDSNMFDHLRDLLHEERVSCFIGICVGMQLLFEHGVEDGENSGLGYFSGAIDRLDAELLQSRSKTSIFPNTHWERVHGGDLSGPYYFTHSFGNLRSRDRLAYYKIDGMEVTAAARRGNVTGFQFHPEKSADQGLALLAKTLDAANL